MDFESFLLTVIAANVIILSVFTIFAWKTGGRGQFTLRISFSILLLVQVRWMNFLGTPVRGHNPSGIGVFPAHFAVMFWIFAGSAALMASSFRRRPNPAPTAVENRLHPWRGTAQLLLFLTSMAFAGYGSLLLLREPAVYGFSDMVITN
ncbi:hypothetical protein [Puniceibacterium confluentis]|uniref:hypothetical protein n=1 Tax=Puniceibacterium confluentis TaxID=1958944 RepID=UPI0011B62CF3|nr:hypothetical protein [Puniceibacterium confluentis]